MCLCSNGNGTRNIVILLLLLDSGLRVSELVGIELNDINLTEGIIKLRKAKVIELFLSGQPYDEIAQQLGIAKVSVVW